MSRNRKIPSSIFLRLLPFDTTKPWWYYNEKPGHHQDQINKKQLAEDRNSVVAIREVAKNISNEANSVRTYYETLLQSPGSADAKRR